MRGWRWRCNELPLYKASNVALKFSICLRSLVVQPLAIYPRHSCREYLRAWTYKIDIVCPQQPFYRLHCHTKYHSMQVRRAWARKGACPPCWTAPLDFSFCQYCQHTSNRHLTRLMPRENEVIIFVTAKWCRGRFTSRVEIPAARSREKRRQGQASWEMEQHEKRLKLMRDNVAAS